MNKTHPFIFILVLLCAVGTTAVAQPVLEWDKSYGGLLWEDCNAVLQTYDGGYLLGGYTSSPVSGDVSENSFDLTANPPDVGDFWIVRTDANGNLLWDKRIGGDGEDRAWTLRELPDSTYLVGGWSRSGMTGLKTTPGRGGMDYWVVKIDRNGNVLWDRSYGGDQDDYLMSLTPTADGGMVLGGMTYSGISGDKTDPWEGDLDLWVIRTDASGAIRWQRNLGGAGEERLNVVQINAAGQIIIGASTGSLPGGNVPGPDRGGKDFWFIVLNDADGSLAWESRMGSNDEEEIQSIVQTADGGYLLAGGSRSNAGGDKTEGNFGSLDFWVVKTDGSGVKQWDRTFGGTGLDNCYTASQNSVGNYLIAGPSESNQGGSKSENSKGGYDIWFLYLDDLGNKLWDKSLGGSNYESLENIFQTTDGGYLAAGHSISNPSGDKTAPNKGLNDFWIVKTRCNITIDLQDVIACPYQPVDVSAVSPSCDQCSWRWSDGARDSLRSFTLTQSTSYAVTLVDGVGCSRTDRINITIRDTVALSVPVQPVLCEGQTLDVTASGASGTILWNTGDVTATINVDTPGVYRIQVTDAYGCWSRDSVEVLSAPSPQVDLGRDTSFCEGLDIALDAGADGVQYAWNTGANTRSITVGQAGPVIAEVTNAFGCITRDTMVIQALYTVPAVNDLQLVCDPSNTYYTLSFDVSGGDSLTWQITGMIGNFAGNTFTIDSLPRGAAYSIQVADVNACAVVQVQGDYDCSCITDAGSVTPDPITLCQGDTLIMNASVNFRLDANDTLLYVLHNGDPNIPGSWLAVNHTPTFTWQPGWPLNSDLFVSAVAGSRLNGRLYEQDGCLDYSNARPIRFITKPFIVFDSQQPLGLSCTTPEIQLVAFNVDTQSGDVFQWSDSLGNVITNAATAIVRDAGTYFIRVTNAAGCSAVDSLLIEASKDQPQVVFATPDTLSCERTQVLVDASGSYLPANTTIRWQGPQPLSTGLEHMVNFSGNYSLVLTNTDNGCADTLQLFVPENKIYPTVQLQDVFVLDCIQKTALLQVNVMNNISYTSQWIDVPGGIMTEPVNDTVQVSKTGTYVVEVYDLKNGCITRDSTLVINDPGLPTGQVEVVPPLCAGNDDGKILLQNISSTHQPLSFSLNGGTWQNDPMFESLGAGEWLVNIRDSRGCEQDTLIQLSEPAVLLVDLGGDTLLNKGAWLNVLPFVNRPVTTYSWNTVNGNITVCPDCTFQLLRAGAGDELILTVTDANGCTASATRKIAVTDSFFVFVPEVFSPNGDGINDRFFLASNGSVEKIKELSIYSRWGECVYHLKEFPIGVESTGWDGHLDGRPMQPSVFVYIATIELLDGSTRQLTGEVTLLR